MNPMLAAFFAGTVATAGVQHGVVFDQPSPLASNTEIARRVLPPLVKAALDRALAQHHAAMADQPVDLAAESFALYVPAQMPAAGYGLLVFVPPWESEGIPRNWLRVLDEKGIILVTANKSGNPQDVLTRRMPLALLAARNVMARYRIDPARVYAGGMSGGSKVAMRLALAWPDLFTGALLNAGAETIGRAALPLPPRDLLAQFQERTRLAYVTGDQDMANQTGDSASIGAMRENCVTAITRITMRHAGHEVADATDLARALDFLDAAAAPDAGLADCRARLDADAGKALDGAQALIDAGKRDEARRALDDLDDRYGGLAAPRSLALDARLRGQEPQK